MEIPQDEVLDLMRQAGRSDEAELARQELPDRVDPDGDSGLLSKFGIDPNELLAWRVATDRTSVSRQMDRPGRQRVAMNEATFRKVNEGMEVGQDPAGLLTFICECGRLRCNKLIRLTRKEYDDLREDPRRFAIVDGHEILEAEKIVARHDRYIVVEKSGDPESEIVERTDPRRPLD